MNIRNTAVLVLSGLVLGALPALAQFPSLSQVPDASHFSRPETVLSGIDISRTDGEQKIQALIRMLGKPTREENDLKNRLRHYYWESNGPDLRITETIPQSGRPESRTVSIEVWGRHPKGKIGMTGAGLALGATLRDAQRAYPFAFQYPALRFGRYLTLLDGHTTGSVGDESGCSLYLQIDFDHDAIVHMKLTDPLNICWD